MQNKIDFYLQCTIAIFVGCASFLLEWYFYKVGILSQWDTLFDADPVSYLSEFANGWGGGKRGNFSHPNISNYFNPIFRVIEKLTSWVPPINHELSTRQYLALFIMPTSSALQAAILFKLIIRLNYTRVLALIITAISTLSFSQIIFGSLPESFGLSSLGITCGLFMMTTPGIQEKLFSKRWSLIQTLVSGITITNVIPIFIMNFFKLLLEKVKPHRSVFRAGANAVAGVALAFSISALFDILYQAPKTDTNDAVRNEALATHPLERFSEFPVALLHTIIATPPHIRANERAIARDLRIKYVFTFHKINQGIPEYLIKFSSILFTLALFIGGAFLYKGSTIEKKISLASISIIIYNWLFHSFWGTELFLYSQHWLVPELILLSGLFKLPTNMMLRNIFAATALLSIAAINSSIFLSIVNVLSTA